MGFPVAFSHDKNCVLTQADIRNAEKNEFPDSIYQNLQLIIN